MKLIYQNESFGIFKDQRGVTFTKANDWIIFYSWRFLEQWLTAGKGLEGIEDDKLQWSIGVTAVMKTADVKEIYELLQKHYVEKIENLANQITKLN
jgi:hypothetical protein